MKEDQEEPCDALISQAKTGLARNSRQLIRRGLDALSKQQSIDSLLAIGVGFDEAIYAKAKPHFEAGIAYYKDMTPVDALGSLMRELRTSYSFQLDQIAAMKPYVIRYIQELEREKAWTSIGELGDEMELGTVKDLDEIIARLSDDLAIIEHNSGAADEETDR